MKVRAKEDLKRQKKFSPQNNHKQLLPIMNNLQIKKKTLEKFQTALV